MPVEAVHITWIPFKKLLSCVTPKGSFGRSRRMNPQVAGPERVFQDEYFFVFFSVILFSSVGNRRQKPRQADKVEGLNTNTVLLTICGSRINEQRLLSFGSPGGGPGFSTFAVLKSGLMPFLLPVLRMVLAFLKPRSESKPSLSSAGHSCGIYSSGWRF